MDTIKLIKFLKLALHLILWLSPIAAMIRDTVHAISSGYNEKFLTDPGHKRVKLYDKIIVIVVWIVVSFILLKTNNFDVQKLLENFWPSFIFPETSTLVSFILLYVVAIVLYFYGSKRANVIRRINEKAGVW